MAGDNPNYPVSTAAVAFDNGSAVELHVFSCDGFNVVQRVSTSNGWVDGTLSVSGSTVSAAGWTDVNGPHLRVYCTTENTTLEWCQDGDGAAWYQGQYTAP